MVGWCVDASHASYDEDPLDEPDEWGDLASSREAAGRARLRCGETWWCEMAEIGRRPVVVLFRDAAPCCTPTPGPGGCRPARWMASTGSLGRLHPLVRLRAPPTGRVRRHRDGPPTHHCAARPAVHHPLPRRLGSQGAAVFWSARLHETGPDPVGPVSRRHITTVAAMTSATCSATGDLGDRSARRAPGEER
jgi:hypothetical protein